MRTLSPTLERLGLRTAHLIVPSRPLGEALPLQRQKELEINRSSDLGGIANLSLLEQLSFSLEYGDSDSSMTGLITHLDNLQKFPLSSPS